MKTLKAGDIRQKGDEVRAHAYAKPEENFGWMTATEGHRSGENKRETTEEWNRLSPQREWQAISLIGHPILASDLMHAEYRRP